MSGRVVGGTVMVIALVLGVSWLAEAASPKIKVGVTVAAASMSGASVDTRLEHFAKDMKRQKLAYTNFAVTGESSFDLEEGKSGDITLPNGKTATVEFRQMDTDGKIRVKVHVPGRGYVTFSRAPGKELFFQADSVHGGADTWLILVLAAP